MKYNVILFKDIPFIQQHSNTRKLRRRHIFTADVCYVVLKEALMDCYQHCVERYGISLSDKNGKSAKGCYN